MPTLSTYLTFNGNCEAAFNFYKSVFGGEFQSLMRFKDMPPSEGISIPEADAEKLMHVSLPLSDDHRLMGSDTSEHFGAVEVGNNFSMSLGVESKAAADRLFHALSEGGKIIMPMNHTFWGSYFGQVRDQFGIQWMVSYDAPQTS